MADEMARRAGLARYLGSIERAEVSATITCWERRTGRDPSGRSADAMTMAIARY
jgi:hypothetical protein